MLEVEEVRLSDFTNVKLLFFELFEMSVGFVKDKLQVLLLIRFTKGSLKNNEEKFLQFPCSSYPLLSY